MKKYCSAIVRLSLLLIGLATLASCGQKGPLEVERPPTTPQEDILEDAI